MMCSGMMRWRSRREKGRVNFFDVVRIPFSWFHENMKHRWLRVELSKNLKLLTVSDLISCPNFDDFVEIRIIWWFNTFNNIIMNIISVFMFVKQCVTSTNRRLDFHNLLRKPQNASIWPQIWGSKIDDQHA